MKEMIEVNYLALILAVVISMVLGFLWYSSALFGKPWMKRMGHTPESIKKDQSQMGKWYLVSAVAALVTAYVLSHVMSLSENFYNYTPVMSGLSSAFWMWLGFIAPVQLTDVLFGKRDWTLYAINTGYQLVSILLMGLVIGLF